MNEISAVLIPSNHHVTRKLNDNGISIAIIVQPTISESTSRRIFVSHLEFLLQISYTIRRQEYRQPVSFEQCL